MSQSHISIINTSLNLNLIYILLLCHESNINHPTNMNSTYLILLDIKFNNNVMPTYPKKDKNKIVKIIDERSPPEQMENYNQTDIEHPRE